MDGVNQETERRVMPYTDLEDEEELDGQSRPDDSIAGRQTPGEQVMQRITQVRSGVSGDEDEGAPDEAALNFARQNSMTAGLGRGLNALAAGTGFRPDNSGYDAMEKQGSDMLNRSAAVQ